jgi:hypothetical protein
MNSIKKSTALTEVREGENHEAERKAFCILSVGSHWSGKPVRSGSKSQRELRQTRIHP